MRYNIDQKLFEIVESGSKSIEDYLGQAADPTLEEGKD